MAFSLNSLGNIAPLIGVVFIIAAIMIARRLMAGTPDTHGIKDVGKTAPDKEKDAEKKWWQAETKLEKLGRSLVRVAGGKVVDMDKIKKLVEALNVEAGVVHKLETEEKREHDEEGFEEARVGEVAKEIQDETVAIEEEISAEKIHNAAAEKKAMEHEKKAVGTLEKDLQAIARQLKQYVGDEQKLSGDFEIAIGKLRKLNQNMIKIELSVTPDNAEANNKDRIGDILSLEKKTKATEQSSEQIINAIEAEINRVRADIQGVKSSYSQQAHETLKNDLSTLRLSLGTEFQKITELRAENDKEHEEVELMFEESVKGLEVVKKKISEKVAEEKRKLVEEEKRLAEEARTAEEEEHKIEAEIEKAKREDEAEQLGSEIRALEEEKIRELEELLLEKRAIIRERKELTEEINKLKSLFLKGEATPEEGFQSLFTSIQELSAKEMELNSKKNKFISEIDNKIFKKKAEIKGGTVEYDSNSMTISKGGTTFKI
jgi:hypothetical protein